MTIRFTSHSPAPILNGHMRMGGTNPAGESISINSRYVTRGGRPVIPVMGEYHFSRDSRENWSRELAKIKAGGIGIGSGALGRRLGIPVKAQPIQILTQLADIFRTAAVRVQVLHAQQHPAVLAADGQPGQHGGKYIAQVHASAGTGGKTSDRCHSVLL